MKHFLILSAMLFSFAASAQTEQEYVYENMPKPENDTYRYVVVSGMSTIEEANKSYSQEELENMYKKTGYIPVKKDGLGNGYAEAEKDAVEKMKNMQAKRFSLPTDSISVEFLFAAKEISNYKVYVAKMFAEVLKDGRSCLHYLCLVPESEKVIFDICSMPESDYQKWAITNLEQIKKFREKHEK